jgi:hypothetical protein
MTQGMTAQISSWLNPRMAGGEGSCVGHEAWGTRRETPVYPNYGRLRNARSCFAGVLMAPGGVQLLTQLICAVIPCEM